MSKLKLGPLVDDRPVKVSFEIPASIHRDLIAYAEALALETGQSTIEPTRLIAPMIDLFMASDKGFKRTGRGS